LVRTFLFCFDLFSLAFGCSVDNLCPVSVVWLIRGVA
jgi:hypothetical protein